MTILVFTPQKKSLKFEWTEADVKKEAIATEHESEESSGALIEMAFAKEKVGERKRWLVRVLCCVSFEQFFFFKKKNPH